MSNETKGAGFTSKKNNALTLKTNHILAIGIDEYTHERPLKNPVDDCQKIIEVLCDRYRFEKENIKTLFNEEATRDNIINVLWKYRNLTDQDNLIILFSGHGDYDKPSDVGFWIPVNAQGPSQYITKADVMMQLKAFKAHHVALVIDSCFSGAMTREKKKELQKENQNYLASLRSYKRKSRWAMTSGRVELVFDGNKGENSPFASSLLSELKNNDKGMLLFSELGVAVRNITNRNADQDPSCNYLREVGDLNGEFSFILKDYKPDLIEIQTENKDSRKANPDPEKRTEEKENFIDKKEKTQPMLQGIDALKKELRTLWIKNELEKIYELLMEKMKEDSSLKTTVYMRCADWNNLNEDIAIGIAVNVQQRKAQNRHALDYVIKNLSEDDLIN